MTRDPNDKAFLRSFERLLKKHGIELAVLCYEDTEGKMSLSEFAHGGNQYKSCTLANEIIGVIPTVMKELKRIEGMRN